MSKLPAAASGRVTGRRLASLDEAKLKVFQEGGVDFVLVGGLAARAHGAARSTQDVDVVYSRSKANLRRLQAAPVAYDPYPWGAPAGLPFRWDEAEPASTSH